MRYDLIAFTVVLAALLLAMYYVPPSQLVLLPTVMIMSAVASSVITWGMLRGGSSADIRTTVISSLLGSVGGILLAQGIAAFAGQPSISAPVPVALLNAFSGAFIGSVITTIMTSGEISGAVSTSTVVAAAVLVAIMFAIALIIVLTGTGPLVVFFVLLLAAVYGGKRLGLNDRDVLLLAALLTIAFIFWQMGELTIVPIP